MFQHLAENKAHVTVEMKNDVEISGALDSVDPFLNVKLNNVTCTDPEKFPHLLSVKNCFIRGSAVRYIHFSPADVDLDLLHEVCRKENAPARAAATGGEKKKAKH